MARIRRGPPSNSHSPSLHCLSCPLAFLEGPRKRQHRRQVAGKKLHPGTNRADLSKTPTAGHRIRPTSTTVTNVMRPNSVHEPRESSTQIPLQRRLPLQPGAKLAPAVFNLLFIPLSSWRKTLRTNPASIRVLSLFQLLIGLPNPEWQKLRLSPTDGLSHSKGQARLKLVIAPLAGSAPPKSLIKYPGLTPSIRGLPCLHRRLSFVHALESTQNP